MTFLNCQTADKAVSTLHTNSHQSKMTEPWQQQAENKRRAILESIPQKWHLPPDSIPTADEQPDITGSYLHRFLERKEVEITECDATVIVQKTTSGEWSAVEVTEVFCHRAALAHQYVSFAD